MRMVAAISWGRCEWRRKGGFAFPSVRFDGYGNVPYRKNCNEAGTPTHRPAGSAFTARRDGASKTGRRDPGTLTDFVVAAADEAACRAIQETEIIRLSIEGQRQIAAAILNPPAPSPALKKAAKRYRELFGVE
jgi:hypothetical protein